MRSWADSASSYSTNQATYMNAQANIIVRANHPATIQACVLKAPSVSFPVYDPGRLGLPGICAFVFCSRHPAIDKRSEKLCTIAHARPTTKVSTIPMKPGRRAGVSDRDFMRAQ